MAGYSERTSSKFNPGMMMVSFSTLRGMIYTGTGSGVFGGEGLTEEATLTTCGADGSAGSATGSVCRGRRLSCVVSPLLHLHKSHTQLVGAWYPPGTGESTTSNKSYKKLCRRYGSLLCSPVGIWREIARGACLVLLNRSLRLFSGSCPQTRNPRKSFCALPASTSRLSKPLLFHTQSACRPAKPWQSRTSRFCSYKMEVSAVVSP